MIQHQGQISVTRAFSGFQVEGHMFQLLLTPEHSGNLGVQCIVLPSATGWSQAARMGNEDLPSIFALEEIRLTADRLECLAKKPHYAPFYSAGFVVELEPGMHPAIAGVLPQVRAVAQIASKLQEVTEAEKPAYSDSWFLYERDLPAIVAAAVFDGLDPAAAVGSEMDRYRECEPPIDDARAEELAAFCKVVERTLPRILEEQLRLQHTRSS